LALALAFASCGGGSGGTEETLPPTPPTQAPTDAPVPVPPHKTVISMTVLSHPRLPSFEGAKPDLTGLEVIVKWNDGTDKRVLADDLNLTTDPPVAHVNQATVHTFWSQYTLQYIERNEDEAFSDPYNDPVYGVNIWIPAVIALTDTAGTATTDPDHVVMNITGGPIKEIYEDLGVTEKAATGLKLEAEYMPFVFGIDYGYVCSGTPGTATFSTGIPIFGGNTANTGLPLDYYRDWKAVYGWEPADYAKVVADAALADKDKAAKKFWDAFDWPKHYLKNEGVTGIDFVQASPISSDPRAWMIGKKKDSMPSVGNTMAQPDALYLAGLNKPLDFKGIDKMPVEIKDFYWVDRINYLEGDEIKDVEPVPADEKTYGGSNVAWAITARSGINRKNEVYVTEVGEETQIAWLWKLFNARLRFEVIYFNAKDTSMPKRVITMYDYLRAMNTVDEEGTPKASLPIFTGAASVDYLNQAANKTTNPTFNPSSPQYWAYMDGDFDLYMTLFYYSDAIRPFNAADPIAKRSYKGHGRVDPIDYYRNGNGAQIPLATDSVHKVAQFSGFRCITDDGDYTDRRDKTAHGGEPTIIGHLLNADVTVGFPDKAKIAPVHKPITSFAQIIDPTPYRVNRVSLYAQLQKYWDPKWLYDDVENGKPIELSITDNGRWYTFDGEEWDSATYPKDPDAIAGDDANIFGHNIAWAPAAPAKDYKNKYQAVGLADYDFDTIEDQETRSVEVLFPGPPSVGPSEDDSVELLYWVKP